jgi:tetratricopeptide (TPR) repeat protein
MRGQLSRLPVAHVRYADAMYPDLSPFPNAYADLIQEMWDLLEAGPRPVPEIAAHCRERGLFNALVPSEFDTDIEAVSDVTSLTRGIRTARSGVVCRLDVLLLNRVFTHILTADERSSAAVTLDPDLEIIGADVSEFDVPLRLESGGELHPDFPRPGEEGESVIDGPAHWLEVGNAGDVIAILKTEGGAVDVFPVDMFGDGKAEAEAIRAEFDATSQEPEAGYELWPILIDAIASGPDLFTRPVAPIGDLLDAAGLEYRYGMVGLAGTPWRPASAILADKLRAQFAEMYEFEMCCHAAFDTLLNAWDWSVGASQTEPDAVVTVEALTHGNVSLAFTSWANAMGGDVIDVASLYESLGELAGRKGAPAYERAAWMWFADGDMEYAIEDAEAAIALDPDSQSATTLLGHVAAIRGEYQDALRLLRRSNPDDPWIQILDRVYESFPDARRNDPCPCGSGKKHKACCAQNPQVSAIGRMNLLSEKIIEFQQTVMAWRLQPLAHVAATAVNESSDPDDANRYMNQPFLMEIAAIEGSLESFVALWGPLLPQEERDTVDLWLTAARALWEVTQEPEPPYVTLRDTRTGDTVTVYDETLTPNIHTGDMLMGVVVPAFGEDRFLANPLNIDIRHRELTLELFNEQPTDKDLALWFGRVTAPPRLQTTEGQDMVICRAVCKPTSTWDAVAAELDHHFERGEDPGEWIARFINDAGETVIRGTLTRTGSELIIETMSEERFDAILSTLTEITVVSQTREPVTVPHPLDVSQGPGPVDDIEMDPESERFLAEMMRQREDAWIDEEIPLLGGITPRQAAADPTRRGDLIDLLDSFPPAPGGSVQGFDPDRLRRLLDLD